MASAKDFSGSSEEPEADPPNNSNVKADADDDEPPAPTSAADGDEEEVGVNKGEKEQGSILQEAEETDPLSSTVISVVYFTVGDNHETALVPLDSPPDDIKDMFRAAAEAGPCDIVKLYTPDGQLLNISPTIPPNTPSTPYRLEVMAVHCNAVIMEQVGIDLLSLEKRVAALEYCFQRQSSPHESVQELKQEVNKLRTKLENYEHLSWLGFYKALHPPPIMDPSEGAVRQPLGPGYHRRSKDAKQTICDKFLRLSDVVLTKETCQLLREPTFDNWQWEDEEMLVLMQQMYLELELPKKFNIEINILRNFLVRVYHNYNDVPFHNFRHCFCVTQMMFGMACTVNLSERIGDLETLILLTSCICHDLDHPGYNNIYQINAQTELALRYNDISPLENHHCSVAFRILEDPECNIFRNLSGEMFKRIREGMIRCILATDMARHNEIVNQFREVVPYFDRNNKVHVNLLSMVLIKVADISNEARPMNVAEPWLDCLLAEFFQQSDTEKLEGLPVTPFMDREKITKPSSQCSFIGLVLLPLFEALGSFFAELDPMIIQPVRDALEYYRRLNEASQPARHRKSSDVTAMQSVNAGTTVGQASTTTTSQSAGDNACDKLPSDANIISKVEATVIPSSPPPNIATKLSSIIDAPTTDPMPPVAVPMGHRNSNPLSYRRASQLLMLKASGSSNSLKVVGLQPLRSTSSGTTTTSGNFQSFPSVESESDKEGDDCMGSEDEAITEVAVSEKALKFKIATEPSFDFSTSRKGSRENKSESSGQSTGAAKDDRISFDTSLSSTPKVDFISATHSSSTTPRGGNSPGKHISTKATCSTSASSSSSKSKTKDSFFSRLKLFTERLSYSADSTTSGGSGGSAESPPGTTYKQPAPAGFHYFRRGRKGERDSKKRAKDGSKSDERYYSKHRGSSSDPEAHVPAPDEKLSVEVGKDIVNVGGSGGGGEAVSPECSPALSGASGTEHRRSSWKHCSGSLDSVLSKDENAKRSPSRRLMLPRFSSFVQKKTRMGFMRRSSPKGSNSSEPQSQS
ncbi:unnamed protein product [Orchesella dallaii]|uniref:Phosphodiesterase n=1 Tax=Orchesella dallaii TaxID=48710 RepID=A0ABP1S909_9HEXA